MNRPVALLLLTTASACTTPRAAEPPPRPELWVRDLTPTPSMPPLFAEERAALSESIASRLTRPDAPWRLLAPDRRRALEARLAAGKREEQGPVCGIPPSSAEVAEKEGVQVVEAQVDVRGLLRVETRLLRPGEPPTWSASAAAFDVPSLMEAGRQLEPRDAHAAPLPSRHGALDQPAPRAHATRTFGPAGEPTTWPALDLSRCAARLPERLSAGSAVAVLSVDDQGRLVRCEPASGDLLATCTCDAALGTAFPIGAARRATYEARIPPPAPVREALGRAPHLRISGLESTHPSALDPLLDAEAVQRCTTALPAQAAGAFTVALEFDGGGRAVKAKVTSASPTLQPALPCLEAAFAQAALPCHPDGAESRAAFDVAVER